MRVMTPEILASLREQFPQGARVELLRMDDPQAPPIGAKGIVRGVDDTGSIMVAWDSGGSLNVLFGVDECRIIKKEGA
ncbi:MAG: DUF4314 domain-containing protein [Oscillospiraceae bacterium]|nr:DUF4314 domain-containing protein [Oscillospiraceae bacterium]